MNYSPNSGTPDEYCETLDLYFICSRYLKEIFFNTFFKFIYSLVKLCDFFLKILRKHKILAYIKGHYIDIN